MLFAPALPVIESANGEPVAFSMLGEDVGALAGGRAARGSTLTPTVDDPKTARSRPSPPSSRSSPSPPDSESLPGPPVMVFAPAVPARVSEPDPPTTFSTLEIEIGSGAGVLGGRHGEVDRHGGSGRRVADGVRAVPAVQHVVAVPADDRGRRLPEPEIVFAVADPVNESFRGRAEEVLDARDGVRPRTDGVLRRDRRQVRRSRRRRWMRTSGGRSRLLPLIVSLPSPPFSVSFPMPPVS